MTSRGLIAYIWHTVELVSQTIYYCNNFGLNRKKCKEKKMKNKNNEDWKIRIKKMKVVAACSSPGKNPRF